MSRLEETRNIRLEKLKKLEQLGINAYPSQTNRTHAIKEVLDGFNSLTKSKKKVTVCGRLKSIRKHGASCFADIQDSTGQIQMFIRKDGVGEKSYKIFTELFDPSDIIEATGLAFNTKKGEKTVLVKKVSMLSKALLTIPEDHYGLKDIETILRKRYLDLAVNQGTRDLFIKKSIFWKTVRDFMIKSDFLEVETPILERVPGGAEAEPFVTHHNALDQDFYLRISLELPLKRLLVGGYEKVFEIGRIFRNEGISHEHLQDYTQMEFYWAYAEYNALMKFVEKLFKEIVKNVHGKHKVKSYGKEIDFSAKWKVYDYFKLFKENTGLDLASTNMAELKSKAKALGIKLESFAGEGRVIDAIYKKAVRPKLIEPGFLINPPVEIELLAKRLPDNPKRVQRMQVVAWGTELGKGFSELNDPVDQRRRFEEQMKLRQKGDKEAQQLDSDYVEAMEYGMPPNAGFGMSERFFAVLMDRPIRETVIFPPMKVEKND